MSNNTESIPRILVTPKKEKPEGADSKNAARHTVVISADDKAAVSGSQGLTSQYTIVEKIGEGGMGVVYLGRDRKLGRFVAIKRLNRGSMSHATLKERFMREAKAIASLNHIHIVHIYALGEDEEGPYIVMEYLAGPQEASPSKTPPAPFTLADRVNRNGPLFVNDAVDLVLKLSKAIEFAHAYGVIHRDLKPSNVLLDETGEPKIVDFGLARVGDSGDDPLTVPGEKMLSLGYGAPEQEQDASLTDHRADVYGLGAILYFSITGKNPRYFRENDVPETLRMPILKAIETDRDKRWSTAREYINALNMIKEPSKIELPTIKTTWRCKWCDTVNPIAIQFCGKCGWDGGEYCAECGSETRVGIQFCGGCGADAREYEQVRLLVRRLKQFRERKQFELIPPHAERIASFRPVGIGGQKLIEQVRQMSREALDAVTRRAQLKTSIQREISGANYELARDLINEYDRLTHDNGFAGEAKQFPDLTLKRDLDRTRKAMNDGEWQYARRTCNYILDHSSSDNPEALSLMKAIMRHRKKVLARSICFTLTGVILVYVLSAAPVFKISGKPKEGRYFGVYAPVAYLHNSTFLQHPLEKYAALFGATTMFRAATAADGSLVIPGERPDEMSALRNGYEALIARIETEYNDQKDGWPTQYQQALADLKQRIQKSGDFEGWIAVKGEIDRFGSEKNLLEESISASPGELRDLQLKQQDLLGKYALEKSSKVILAMQEYVNQLTPLQKDLTMRGRMGDAMRVNTEIKRVKTSPEVAAAELEVEKHDTAARKP